MRGGGGGGVGGCVLGGEACKFLDDDALSIPSVEQRPDAHASCHPMHLLTPHAHWHKQSNSKLVPQVFFSVTSLMITARAIPCEAATTAAATTSSSATIVAWRTHRGLFITLCWHIILAHLATPHPSPHLLTHPRVDRAARPERSHGTSTFPLHLSQPGASRLKISA